MKIHRDAEKCKELKVKVENITEEQIRKIVITCGNLLRLKAALENASTKLSLAFLTMNNYSASKNIERPQQVRMFFTIWIPI